VSLTDWHVPYEDEVALALAFQFCADLQPGKIIIHEAHDFYSVSKFDKDPERINGLQDELDKVFIYLKKLRGLCPKAEIIFLNSNHLMRLKKFLWRKAPELCSLRSLELISLLRLKQLNIEFKENYEYRGVLFKHGSVARKHSAYTARAEFDKELTSGVSGHTHRLGQYYTRKRGGYFSWIECGCLCDLSPEYAEGEVMDWQQGFGLVSFKENSNRFEMHAIPIIDNKIIWGGKEVVYD